jgi:hypothetical protein
MSGLGHGHSTDIGRVGRDRDYGLGGYKAAIKVKAGTRSLGDWGFGYEERPGRMGEGEIGIFVCPGFLDT